MRVKLHEIQAYAKTLADLADEASASANADIALWMSMNPDATIAECREFAKAAVRAALMRYGDAASVNATRLYDEVMAGEGIDVPPATIYDGPDDERVDGTVRRLAGRLDSKTPDRDGFIEQVGKFVSDETRRAARETVAQNVQRDAKTKKGKHIRFARVPQRPDPCGWCVMLASRGFDYLSEDSAAAGNHHNCTCLVVPGVKGSTIVDGYDTKALKERWKRFSEIDSRPDLSSDEKQFLKRISVESDTPLNLSDVARRIGEIENAFGVNTEEGLLRGAAIFDYSWILSGSIPTIGYDAPSTEVKKKKDPAHIDEVHTVDKLRKHGLRSTFWDDEWQEDNPEGKGKITRSRGDLDSGVEIKTVYRSSALSTFDKHVRNTKKKTGVTKLIVDVSENENITDAQAYDMLAEALRNRRYPEALLLTSEDELVRVLPSTKSADTVLTK